MCACVCACPGGCAALGSVLGLGRVEKSGLCSHQKTTDLWQIFTQQTIISLSAPLPFGVLQFTFLMEVWCKEEHQCNVVKVGQRPLWKLQIQTFLTQVLGLDMDLCPGRARLGGGELCLHSGYSVLCVGTQKNTPGLWIQELPVSLV